MRLLFAGLLTLLAGVISTAPHTWVVAVVGGMMIGCALYRHQLQLAALRIRCGQVGQTLGRDQIVRERWRETRTRQR